MAGVNKAIVVGHLGADPEVRFTASGQCVCNFNLATSERWKDKEGNPQDRTEWHRIVAWGKLGEICKEYLSKGRQAYVEGRIQTRQWEDKDGHKRYTTEIVAQNIQFLGGPGQQSTASSSGPSSDNAPLPDSIAGDDDIPF
jgi:single-strand DNA-binding protein